MSILQPRDSYSSPIPVLAQEGVINGSTSPTASSSAIAGAEKKVVRIAVSEATYVLFTVTGVDVTAFTGSYLPAGSTTDWAVESGVTHVSHLQVSSPGVISITSLA